jgi:hypothetical protein
VSKSHGSTTSDLRIESPQPESEVLRHRVEEGTTHLLGLAQVLRMVAEQATEQSHLLYLLAKNCETEAGLLGDVEVFLAKLHPKAVA